MKLITIWVPLTPELYNNPNEFFFLHSCLQRCDSEGFVILQIFCFLMCDITMSTNPNSIYCPKEMEKQRVNPQTNRWDQSCAHLPKYFNGNQSEETGSDKLGVNCGAWRFVCWTCCSCWQMFLLNFISVTQFHSKIIHKWSH